MMRAPAEDEAAWDAAIAETMQAPPTSENSSQDELKRTMGKVLRVLEGLHARMDAEVARRVADADAKRAAELDDLRARVETLEASAAAARDASRDRDSFEVRRAAGASNRTDASSEPVLESIGRVLLAPGGKRRRLQVLDARLACARPDDVGPYAGSSPVAFLGRRPRPSVAFRSRPATCAPRRSRRASD